MNKSNSDGMICHLKIENHIDERILTKSCECVLEFANDKCNLKYSLTDTKSSVNYGCKVDQYNNDDEDGKENITNER